MDKRLEDKVALVSGAGSIGPGWGNGKATAVLFARAGARVVAIDRNLAAAEETRDIIRAEGGACEAAACDVSKEAQVKAVIDGCVERHGRLDVLHNNVGIFELGSWTETTVESWDRVHDVNLKSVFLACKHALPHMERQGKGAIVNIASIAAIRHVGIPYPSYYSSKAAVVQITRAIALDYAVKGIRANCILPGLINTPMVHVGLTSVYGEEGDVDALIAARDQISPTGKMGDAWDVAHAALFLASDEAKYVNGVALAVDGGLSARIR